MYNSSSARHPYDYKSQNDQIYQSKPITQRNHPYDYQNRFPHSPDRFPNRHSRQQRSRSRERPLDKAAIKVEARPKIQILNSAPKSQIKVHFRFKEIRIDPIHETQLMEKLKQYFAQQYGPVTNLSKSSDSEPGFLIMELGFQRDPSAQKALKYGIDKLMISVNDKTIQISARPTNIFQVWLSLQKNKNVKKRQSSSSSSSRSSDHKKSRKQKPSKRVKISSRNYSQSRSSSYSSYSSRSSSERSYKNHNKSKDRSTHSRGVVQASNQRFSSYNNSKRDNYNDSKKWKKDYHDSRDRSYERSKGEMSTRHEIIGSNEFKQAPKTYKTLLFWGIHVTISAKIIDEFLQTHRNGCFISKRDLVWKKLDGFRVCQILQGQFEERMAQKLLRSQTPLEVNGHPFIPIDADLADKSRYIQKISEYQVNIKLPTEVEPYYVMKSMNECGKVIQVVSNNKFTESGLSDSYNVTFASKQVCRKLKSLKRTSKGIIIYEASSEDKFVPVYRPTYNIQLDIKKESDAQNRPTQETSIRSKNYSARFSPDSRIAQDETYQ